MCEPSNPATGNPVDQAPEDAHPDEGAGKEGSVLSEVSRRPEVDLHRCPHDRGPESPEDSLIGESEDNQPDRDLDPQARSRDQYTMAALVPPNPGNHVVNPPIA